MVDEVLLNLAMANRAMQEYVNIDFERLLLESEDDELEEQLVKNAEAEQKSTNFIKKGIDALIKMIQSAIAKMDDFFKKMFMSKDQKDKFKEFEDMIKSDPDLAKIKVTVRDFKEYEAAYDKALKAIDAAEKNQNTTAAEDAEIAEDINNILAADLSNMVKSIAQEVPGQLANEGTKLVGRAVKSVTADTLLKMAREDRRNARLIRGALETQSNYLETLTSGMNEKDAKRFDKKLKAYSKGTFWQKIKATILIGRKKSCEDIIVEEFRILTSLIPKKQYDGTKKGPDAIDAFKARGIARGATGMSNSELIRGAFDIKMASKRREKSKFRKAVNKQAKRY